MNELRNFKRKASPFTAVSYPYVPGDLDRCFIMLLVDGYWSTTTLSAGRHGNFLQETLSEAVSVTVDPVEPTRDESRCSGFAFQ